jgi:hypothetical protein
VLLLAACALHDSVIDTAAVQGVYYGTFAGGHEASEQLESIWVVSRPHNWHPQSTEEYLLHLALPDGHEIERNRLPSRCTKLSAMSWPCRGHVVAMSWPCQAGRPRNLS